MACAGCEKRRQWLKEQAGTVKQILSGERAVEINGKLFKVPAQEKK